MFAGCVERLAEAFLAEPSDDTLFNILALPKAGLAPGLKQGLKARLERYPRVDWPRPEPSDGTAPRTTTAVKDVEKGRLGSAARRLAGTAAVATVDNEVVATLRDKHPSGPEDPFGPTDGPSSGDIPSEEEIMAAFKTFKPDTSPGLSGWTHHLLATALRVPAFLKAIHTLTGLIMVGTAPGQAMLCASRLTPLRKPDGGLRPIAVGDMIYRLATKAIVRHSNRRDFLLPYQFGVGSKGGVEPVVRAVERALEGTLDRPYTHLTSLDFSNAFNTVDRRDIAEGLRQYAPILYRAGRWAYGCTSSLVLGSPEGRHIINSAQGVRQGDPMGPLMFSLGIRSLLRDLASALGPDRLILAYLDDIYILSPDDQALEQTLAFFDERQPSIRLNPAKCKSLALEDIRTNGLRMLGTCVGARSAREQFLQEKIDHEAATVAKLINLPHQHALLVLRVCVQQNLRHLQRSLKSDDLVHLWDKLDTTLREAVARIRGLPRPTDQLDAAVISLPIKMGGLGVLSYKTVAPHAYAAASEAADATLAPILTPGSLPDSTQLITQHQRCQEIFTGNKEALLGSLTPEQAKAVVEASSKLGRVWLTTIPFQPSLRLTDFEVAAALQLRTLAGEREAHCTNCGETNFFGHPEVCLQRKFRRVARHEGAKHIMGQALASTPGTRVRLEPLGHQTSRRNDIQVFSLLGSQATGLANAEYDLTVVSLANKDARATKLPNQDTDPSRLANKYLDSVADHKVRHRPTSNLPFHPIVFSLGGMMNGSTTKVFASWKRVMTRGTYNLMLKRLSLCLLQARVRSFEL